jgi:ATP-dependent helicase/nuclease subunit A
LTEQQSRPLEVAGASVALSAGAGCGKTMVLTARFLKDLEGEERRPLRSIVALTFTRKAARELRERIRNRCRDRLGAGGDADVAHWKSVLRGLEAAPIGTFHEFCAQWLRRHAVACAIDPEFIVLDETVAGAVRDESLGRSLRDWLAAADSDLIELAVEFGLARVRQALVDLATHRALGDLEPWADCSVDQIVACWKTAWQAKGRPAALQRVRQVAGACRACLTEHESSHAKMRERRTFLLEHLPAIDGPDVPDSVLSEIREQAKVQGGGTKDHWPSPAIYEQVKTHFENVRKEIDQFLTKSGQWDEAATNQAAEFGRQLARLAQSFQRTYDAAKRARGGLDFDDLLLRTRNRLLKQPELAGDRDGRILTRYLIDEFQDTDVVQGQILALLGGESFAAGRLFLVGDLKQSIYRFRGADPEVFRKFRADFPAAGHHALTENYRSVPAILDFVNALFSNVFDEPDNRLIPVRKPLTGDDQPAVEFLWAVEPETETKTQVRDRRRTEARWIARRLRQRLDAGWIVQDRKTGEPRPAGPGDIALLFRAMTGVEVYESALADEGFDYHVVGGSAFYAQQEILDLINVLSVIEDPFDAVALAGALRSPFFCVSDDGLFWLATARSGVLAEGLWHAGEIAELSPLDRQQAVRACDLLRHWRAQKDRLPIAALVDRVLDESGYEAALLGEYLGGRKRANARKLVRMARTLDQQGGFTVADFVTRLRADLRRPPREDQAATTDEEGTSIRLMSIHQAKGLEFPIVVLPDLNRKPPENTEFVAFHPELGPVVRFSRDPATGDEAESDEAGQSLGWRCYRALERHEEEKESLRLFYVAATRARDALILSAGLAPEEKPASPALALLSLRFDRARGACRAALPDGWAVPRVHVTLECPVSSRTAAGEPVSRPRLNEVASAITTAELSAEVPPPSPQPHQQQPRPRLVDLDPALGLPSSLARLDRLIRTILADPRSLAPKELPRVAAEAARRQHPAAPTSLIAGALDRLRPWLDGMLGRTLASATEIERGLAWTIAWPPEAPERTVYQGTVDLLVRDQWGDWTSIVVAVAEAAYRDERLRLLLGSRAAAALGFVPIRTGWLVRLGPDPEGGLQIEDSPGAAELESVLRASRIDASRSDGVPLSVTAVDRTRGCIGQE